MAWLRSLLFNRSRRVLTCSHAGRLRSPLAHSSSHHIGSACRLYARFSTARFAHLAASPAPARSSSAVTRSYHGRSRWKWQFRPDLRDVRPNKDVKKEEDPELWQAQMTEGAQWYYEIDPDEIADRMARIMAQSSHNLPNGGLRLGICHALLDIATAPRHLRVVIQALTIMQERNTKKRLDIALKVCQTACRLGVPEMAVSFLNMPWLNLWPTKRMMDLVLSCYSRSATSLVLSRVAAGFPMSYPKFKNKRDKLPSERKEGEEETEEEEEEEETGSEDGRPTPKQLRHLDEFIDNFMSLYDDLRSGRHDWKPTRSHMSRVIRFYASLGDADAALSIHKAVQREQDQVYPSPTYYTLGLALIYKNRAAEALEFLEACPKRDTLLVKTARVAAHAALGQKDEMLQLLRDFESIVPWNLGTHFGKADRMTLLASVVRQIQVETPDKVDESTGAYLDVLEQGEKGEVDLFVEKIDPDFQLEIMGLEAD